MLSDDRATLDGNSPREQDYGEFVIGGSGNPACLQAKREGAPGKGKEGEG